MSEKQDLLYRLQAADFAAYDLLLYLDTHPCCQATLSLYKEKVKEAAALREEYESKYGPIMATSSSKNTPWQWIQNPWVWERRD